MTKKDFKKNDTTEEKNNDNSKAEETRKLKICIAQSAQFTSGVVHISDNVGLTWRPSRSLWVTWNVANYDIDRHRCETMQNYCENKMEEGKT